LEWVFFVAGALLGALAVAGCWLCRREGEPLEPGGRFSFVEEPDPWEFDRPRSGEGGEE
jgi:hypothetical protein